MPGVVDKLIRPAIKTRQWELVVLLAAALLYALLWGQSYLGFLNDDVDYLMAARSLWHGRYAWLYYPGQPPQTHFLPGFSFFLMPFAALGMSSWGALRAIPIVLTLLSGLGIAALGERWGLSRRERVAAMALFLFNPSAVLASGIVASEPCFIAFVLLVLLSADGLLDRPRPDWRVWLMGALVGWISLMRPEGVALIAAWGVLGLFSRWRPAALRIAALAGAIWLAWLLRNWRLTGHAAHYAQEWSADLSSFSPSAQLWRQARTLFVESAAGMIWGAGLFLSAAVALVAGLLSALGWRRLWTANRGPSMILFTVFLGTYLLIHLAWPPVDARYFLPVLPGLSLMWLAAPGAPGRAWTRRAALLGLVMLASTALCHTGAWAMLVCRGQLPAQYALPRATFDWMQARLPVSALVLTNKEGAVFLYTGRRVCPLPVTDGARELYDQLESRGADYVVVFPGPTLSDRVGGLWSRALGIFQTTPGEFRELYRNAVEGTVVYRRLPR